MTFLAALIYDHIEEWLSVSAWNTILKCCQREHHVSTLTVLTFLLMMTFSLSNTLLFSESLIAFKERRTPLL